MTEPTRFIERGQQMVQSALIPERPATPPPPPPPASGARPGSAILYALSGADEDLHAVLDNMSGRELRDLYHAANRLSLTIWIRLGVPRMDRNDRGIPDPRTAHESAPPAAEPGATVWYCAICDAPNASHIYPAEPCPVCGATAVRSGSISGRA